MKASKRKTGGAYRLYKQNMQRHAKQGKDRTKAQNQHAGRKAVYKGYTAVQSVINNNVAIYDLDGRRIGHLQKDKPLTAKELHSDLKYFVDKCGPLVYNFAQPSSGHK